MLNFDTTLTPDSRLAAHDLDNFTFGEIFSDHMFCMDYRDGSWQSGQILPYGPLSLEPGAMVLHYAQMVFEGLKAFRGDDGVIRLFRPDRNAARMRASCERICIPMLHEHLFVEAVKQLVRIDNAWVPNRLGYALYIRPILFSIEPHLEVRPSKAFRFLIMTCPVGGYFSHGKVGLSLKVEENFARTAPYGGVGDCKTAANYATTLQSGTQSRAQGFDQVLWLDGAEHRYIEEAGLANVFFKIGGTVITPELNGAILPGVTRDSVITLLNEMDVTVEQRPVEIDEITQAAHAGTLEEVFATGTAASVTPITSLSRGAETLFPTAAIPGPLAEVLFGRLTGIQYGRLPDPHGWARVVELD